VLVLLTPCVSCSWLHLVQRRLQHQHQQLLLLLPLMLPVLGSTQIITTLRYWYKRIAAARPACAARRADSCRWCVCTTRRSLMVVQRGGTRADITLRAPAQQAAGRSRAPPATRGRRQHAPHQNTALLADAPVGTHGGADAGGAPSGARARPTQLRVGGSREEQDTGGGGGLPRRLRQAQSRGRAHGGVLR
jgi:hypothetical protein